MNKELKETVLKVAEYSNEEKKKSTKIVQVYFFLGAIAMTANIIIRFLELPDSFWTGCLEGVTGGFALGALLLGNLYTSGRMEKICEAKKRILSMKREEV